MGLLLGASIVTICEIVDFVILHIIRLCNARKDG